MKFLSKLRRLAAKSTHRFAFHSTLLLRGGAPVAWGYNHGERHSEVVALGKVRFNGEGLTAINFRLGKSGESRLSKPCTDCHRILLTAGVKRCYYSSSNGEFERLF
ncbi:MAG: hypothetical protein ACRD2L_02040 [Terriglobia bacterium]